MVILVTLYENVLLGIAIISIPFSGTFCCWEGVPSCPPPPRRDYKADKEETGDVPAPN